MNGSWKLHVCAGIMPRAGWGLCTLLLPAVAATNTRPPVMLLLFFFVPVSPCPRVTGLWGHSVPHALGMLPCHPEERSPRRCARVSAVPPGRLGAGLRAGTGMGMGR